MSNRRSKSLKTVTDFTPKQKAFVDVLVANWGQMSKADEIEVAIELGKFDLLKHTLTCYNPIGVVSCGKCPACAERIMNFMKVGRKDPIPYDIDINWEI